MRLVCQDYLKFLRSLPDGAADAVITDPPYGSTDLAWDRPIDLGTFFSEAYRILKPNGLIVIFAAQRFAIKAIAASRGSFRYELVYEKSVPVGFLWSGKMPLRAHEFILVFTQQFKASTYNPQLTEGKPYGRILRPGRCSHYGRHKRTISQAYSGRFPRSCLHFGVERGMHPTQKPLGLLKWLVATYTNDGDMVVDPFLGSGTTALACLELGRDFQGCDTSAEYVRLSRRRIREHQRLQEAV